VTAAVNRISAARLVYLDGAPAAGDFPLSNAATFVPGAEVEVLAGAVDDPVSLFRGVVIRLAIKVREHGAPQLVVECRHAAVKLTVGRKDACFLDLSDADILTGLLDAAGLAGEVESTGEPHPQQVQYRATDWDFLLARAEANGKLVFTTGEGVTVQAPDLGGSPVCTLQYGATLLDLDAEVDARVQLATVKSATWDPAEQAVAEAEAADPGIAGPGNLASAELATVAAPETFALCHAALAPGEAQAWADAQQLKARLNKVSGRAKCEGIAAVRPGDMVTLAGVGERFNGDVYVTGVRHDLDPVHGWKTHVQFGGTDRWASAGHEISAPAAGGLLPGVRGLQIGVAAGNEDPDGEHRVRVRLPLVDPESDGLWARVASPDAGAERGLFFRPEIGDELVVGFLDGDPRRAVVLGMLHSSAKAAPLAGSDDNHEKGLQTRSKLRLAFDDDKKVVRLETPAGNRLTLSEEDQAVTLEDQNGNRIALTADGITIESGKALTLKAGTEVKLESGTAFAVKGGSELKLEGTASAELSSAATTKVKGGVVQIN
jgi:Rhs element Vgr protein